MKKENELGIIHNGVFICYYPLKIETKLGYDSLCNHIAESVADSFRSCGEELHVRISQQENIAFQKPPISAKCRSCDTSIEIEPTDHGIKCRMNLGCMKAYHHRVQQCEAELDEYKKIYGEAFVSMQQRIILPPMHIKLYNEKTVWLNAILILFANKMGLLKLELPLIDVETDYFKEHDVDSYVSTIVGGCILPEETSEISFSEIHSLYIKKFLQRKKIKSIFCGNCISNIILVDCDGTPEQIERIPVGIQKDLYEIIAAPIGERALFSTAGDAKEYLEKHCWGKHFMKCFGSTTGGCLSLIDKKIVLDRKARYAKALGIDDLNSEQATYVYEKLSWSVCINTEFALSILALKKMNVEYVFQEKILGRRSLHKIHAEYNRTLALIAEMQSTCMGTVHEQLHAFEHMMPYYVNSNLAEAKITAIDRIQTDKEQLNREKSQVFLSAMGLILTAVFGLPAIYDTLTLIQKVFQADYPLLQCISVECLSVVCWGVLLIMLLCWCIRAIFKTS